ncbi:Phytanoyl-CoA dioxygenase (PhyH) [Planctomycetes bacterium Pla163]|uniref:Phytanoyl-CoA dioxygenase (PhyH) n=1 Tax=Rohdeia mirabilis TaxID=2528008 RepID=A0A518D3B0_9BACT|nr:Phytanoyl-CoA dioxygenase (PhyH) [Planctomycetes bacterium Pla163]
MSDEERDRAGVGRSGDVARSTASPQPIGAHASLAASAQVQRDGFAIVADVIDGDQRSAALAAFAELDGRVGRRDALDHPAVAQLAAAPRVRRLAEAVLGPDAAVHRAILFDKSPDANWLVRWHQDTVVSVSERFDAPGWTAWSVKDGVPCARPPRDVLESMVSIRVDLDGSDAGNGGLRVVPTSHAHGVLAPEAAVEWRDRVGEVDCVVPALGALILRPLLLHASRKSPSNRSRRIVHLEFLAWSSGGTLRI